MPAMIIGSPLTLGNDTTLESRVNQMIKLQQQVTGLLLTHSSKIANVTNASDDGNAGILLTVLLLFTNSEMP